jgi:hypothetical protein
MFRLTFRLTAIAALCLVPQLASASSLVYGVSAFLPGQNTAALYSIDPQSGATTFVQAVSPSANVDVFSPNGLGYNTTDGKFYYSTCCTTTADLYSLDPTNGQNSHVGTLAGPNATGAFRGDVYYYIPQGGTDVQRVRINADSSATNLGGMGLSFAAVDAGDLEITPNGVLYFSGSLRESGQDILMSINLDQTTSDLSPVANVPLPINVLDTNWFGQLAFANNTMYALTTASGAMYSVNLSNGGISYLSTVQGGLTINDLSSGPAGTNSVPEPATSALLVVGVIGRRIRRRTRTSLILS